MATTKVGRQSAPADPKQHARSIAEAVDAAWHSNHGGSRLEIPIGVVAGLSLVAQADPDRPDPAEFALRLDHEGFAALLLELWTGFAVARPDLLPRIKPLWSWLEDDPQEHTLRAAHAAGQAALHRGQFQLTGVAWRRWEVDQLGMLLQLMRSRGARQGLGQFLTPVDVCEVLGELNGFGAGEELAADMTVDGPDLEAQRILDPCAGTGTMFLGAARAMRRGGRRPADYEWWANDIDWLAAACCAVNMHLWGLGRRIVVGCGDGLQNEWMREALDSRQAAIDELARLWDDARKLAAVRNLLGIEMPASPLARYLSAAQARMPKPPPPPPASSTFDPDAAYRQGALF